MGSLTVEIPGGTATFRDKLTTERQRRPIKRAAFAGSSAIAKLPDLEDGDEKKLTEQLASMPLTEDEADSFMGLMDATILAFLESWTLDSPLPTSRDDLLDLDADVYDALVETARSLQSPEATQETNFEPGPAGDGDTPTVA